MSQAAVEVRKHVTPGPVGRTVGVPMPYAFAARVSLALVVLIAVAWPRTSAAQCTT